MLLGKLMNYKSILFIILALLTLVGIAYAQTGDFYTGSDGKGSNVAAPPNQFTNTLNDTARNYGYATDSELQAALANGYSKLLADGNLWRRANGFTDNPYPTPSGPFTIPGTNPAINMQANQYRTDCRDLHTGRDCSALTKAEFQAVMNLTHAAIMQNYASNQERVAAELAGWTDNADWLNASALNYQPTSSDFTLYDESRSINTYDGFCRLQPGVNTNSPTPCATITKANYLAAKETYNNGWTVADWTAARALGYTNSAADRALYTEAKATTYLTACRAEVPGAGACTDLTRTQFLDAKAGTAALQQVAAIAAGTPGNAPSSLTIALLEAAGMTNGAATRVDASLTALQNDITNSGITTASTTTDIDNWVTAAAGYGTGITYSTVTTALTNGWTAGNYRTASNYAGWTNSAADNSTFGTCLASTATGANACAVSRTAWDATAALVASLGSDSSGAGLNVSDIQAIVASSGGSTSLNIASNQIHAAFVRHCIANLASVTASNIANCVTAGSATPQAAAVFGMANWDAGYTFDNNLLTDAGLDNADAGFFANSGADSCYQASCAQVARDYLASSSNTLTDSSSATAVENALDAAIDAHYTTKANAVAAVTNANAPEGTSCSATTTPAPSLCSHQPNTHIYCTTATSNFSINSPTYDTISYNGSNYATSSTTYLNYTLEYRSRRTNLVLRSETRKIRVISSSSTIYRYQLLTSYRPTCSSARNYCTNDRGGTLGNIGNVPLSQVASLDYVVYQDSGGTLHAANWYGGSWLRTTGGCAGSSYGGSGLKVVCRVPSCS